MDADAIARRLRELEEENLRLRGLLAEHGIAFEGCVREGYLAALQSTQSPLSSQSSTSPQSPQPAHVDLSLQEKVELFQSIFKGREDVFAKRWYSDATKKSGYQPVCEREWDRVLCDKRRFKCSECPNRQFAPLSYEHIFNHLAGKDAYGRDVVGLYPMLNDNTCHFLCTDFDDKSCEHGYQSDVLAFTGVCKEWGVPCYIERSRSGNGAHVWVFFESAVAATKARRLGKSILAEAMNKDVHLSFKSYDRFFPNQDTLPDGGLGNLVALPLQGKARRNGNSVFVDENFQTYPDQWGFLLDIQKLSEPTVDDILQRHASTPGELTKSSEGKPWEAPNPETIAQSDFPARLTLTRANMLYVPLSCLSAKAINYFKRMAAFHNPEFYAKQGMRLSTYDVPRIISCSELTDNYLALPRGCEDDVVELLEANNVEAFIDDKTCRGRAIDVSFKGELREEQQQALASMLSHRVGTLSATTAFGKTVFAIAMIAWRKVNTLILVHRKSLLDQWKRQLSEFLEISDIVEDNSKRRKRHLSPIGELCSGKDSLHGLIDIALIQSCLENNEPKPFVRDYGMVIVDECHHVSSVSFEHTGKYIGEGFDYPRLDTLFLALPISWKGHIAQYAGRLHRDFAGKNEVRIYDYIDIRIPLCDSMYRKRLRGYASVGYGVPKQTEQNRASNPELIYDGNTYFGPFRQDLLAAKRNIVISCRKIKNKIAPRLLFLLRELTANGVEVVVWVSEQGHSESELQKHGIEVQCDENLSVQSTIIDKTVVWYGSINPFSHNTEENNAMRIIDSSVAAALLEIICVPR